MVLNGWLFASHCRCLEAVVRLLERLVLQSHFGLRQELPQGRSWPVRRETGQLRNHFDLVGVEVEAECVGAMEFCLKSDAR